MRTPAQRIEALIAMAAEEEVGQAPLGLYPPITTEYQLDALIDEGERERAASQRKTRNGRRSAPRARSASAPIPASA